MLAAIDALRLILRAILHACCCLMRRRSACAILCDMLLIYSIAAPFDVIDMRADAPLRLPRALYGA